MSKIVVVGSINMDLVVQVPRFPLAGETILGSTFRTIPGGKGANQAVAARRMGADVAMVGRLGNDEFGMTLRQNLAAEGVATGHLATDPSEPSGVALITVESGGENTIIVVPGANGRLTTSDIGAAREQIAGAGALLMQLEIPLEVVEQATRIAAASEVTVVLNAAPAQGLPPALLSLVDYLVVNETEAQLLANAGSLDPEQAARALQGMGARNVVVTLGEDGSMLVAQNGAVTGAPGFAMQAVDTTAAGDSFVGAFAVALAEGMPARDALLWGNAAGALAVTRVGAQPSLPTLAEVKQFLYDRAGARHL